jgi:hypothetical protein
MTQTTRSVLSFNQRRVLIGVVLVLSLLSLGNHAFGWGIGAPYSKKIVVLCFVALTILMLLFLPTQREWTEYRIQKHAAAIKAKR